MRLTELTPSIAEAFLADRIGVGHALEIAKLPQDQQEKAFDAAFRAVWNSGKESRILLPVRELAAWIEQNILLSLDSVPFDKNDATLVPEAGSCVECPKRTGFNTLLFGTAVPVTQAAVTPTEKPRDPVVDAEKALVFKARFASNLVSTSEGATRSSAMQTDSVNTAAGATSVRPTETSQLATGSSSTTTSKRAVEVNVNSAHGQPFVLFEGTTIDTALVNRLDGEFSGPVKVMMTNPVYSQDRQHVLIPEGTFILGEAQKVAGFGQKRLAVAFHRMLMPDGYSVDLDQFHGLDQVGETGLKDKVNNHYMQIFGASIALGIISGAAEATTNSGYSESGSDMYRQGLASSLASSGTNVLDKFINIQPTITIREGHRIKVYISQDMLLPAYENHSMPGVM
jgi:type IV secretion system protein VirB10